MPNRQWLLPVASASGSGGGGGGSTAWSALTAAASNLTLANGTNTTEFDQTSAVNWTWANTTIATVSTTNASPNIVLGENYWTGATSAQDTWTVGSSLVAGSNAVSTLNVTHAGSTGNPKISLFAAANEFLRIAPSLGSSPPLTTVSAQTTNESVRLSGNMSTGAAVAYAVQLLNSPPLTSTSGVQTGVSAGIASIPISFAPASGNAAFFGLASYSTCASSLSSGAVTGFLVNALGNSAIAGTYLTADFQNDNGSVFQVNATGAKFPANSTLTDTAASSGAANAVLTAGAGGGNVVWRAGTSAGPFTGAQITALTTTGGLVTTYTGSSDERLKTEIKPYERGLEAIEKLNPKFYKWNEEGQKKTGFKPEDEHVGLIAQNLQEAIPEAVGLEDGIWLTVNDRPVISTLINAIKQLSARVKELESR